ncbi:MAG: hypothetical protein NWQ45_02785 [Congregibacter sp.]|nr:hypothetical protein [Congregibacter sp.]
MDTQSPKTGCGGLIGFSGFFAVPFALVLLGAAGSAALEVQGLTQLSLVDADSQTSFINSGAGGLRYDEDGLHIQQALLEIRQDFGNAFSAEITANYYPDGDLHAGITQALLKWKPLSQNTLRVRGRVGLFYPRMSAENVDVGWLSPYSYTPSAINSWLGEELRIAGVEGTLFSSGRGRRSPWSWELNAALYGGNDPLGSIIAWRGFATHDRQSLHHDRLQFAPLPAVVEGEQIAGPDWVEPFHEIDNRAGGYLGFHLRHRSGLDFRVYRYDNNGNPNKLNSQRLYAWDTNFSSFALSSPVTENITFLAQWMGGRTEMGPALVVANFESYYLMLSHRQGRNRFSARFDYWDVDEEDDFPEDINDSEGRALTVSWRHDLTDRWQVGVEYVYNESDVANRPTIDEPVSLNQRQLMGVLQYRFGK